MMALGKIACACSTQLHRILRMHIISFRLLAVMSTDINNKLPIVV